MSKFSGASSAIIGKYEFIESKNFDEYMQALGVNPAVRKLGNEAKPVTEISKNGDDWQIKTSTTVKTTELNFRLNQEFQEDTVDGRHCKTVIKQGGKDTLIQLQQWGTTGKNEIRRQFKDDKMIITLKYGGVTATRIYKKIH